MKQVVLVALFISVFLPFGSVIAISAGPQLWTSILLAVAVFFLKLVVFYFIVAVLENAMARVRFLKASAVTWTALGAAILSFVFYLANV